MTLASSGSLTSTAINTETGQVDFDMNGTEERNLAGRYSGSYVWSDYWGQVVGGDCVEGTSTSGQTVSGTVTINNVTFGTPTPWNREIFLCVSWGCTTSAVETNITSATIGGVAAVIHITYGEGGTSAVSNYGVAIISARVPTGTTGTVTITFSNSTIRNVYITPYWVYGLVSQTVQDSGAGFDEHLFAPSTVSATAALTGSAANDDNLFFFSTVISSDGTISNISTSIITEQQEATVAPEMRYSNGFRFLASGARSPASSSGATDASRIRIVTACFEVR